MLPQNKKCVCVSACVHVCLVLYIHDVYTCDCGYVCRCLSFHLCPPPRLPLKIEKERTEQRGQALQKSFVDNCPDEWKAVKLYHVEAPSSVAYS